ncbi:MAG: hypothetical protein JWQ75_3450 [Pseudarthrobacter sp.]|nr:hypothetical protein [Pseudarthrobacter sp.]
MQTVPRITVEVPVLGVGAGPGGDEDLGYEELGGYVDALRRLQGLHLTLLHIGILADFSQDVADWTKGVTDACTAAAETARWLRNLPELDGFSGTAERLVVLGGGGIVGLEVDVPLQVHDYQVGLVQGLHGLLDDLLVDNVDDFILGSRALGFRFPRWLPHVAVGRPRSRARGPWPIPPRTIHFGGSRIRNGQFLPAADGN